MNISEPCNRILLTFVSICFSLTFLVGISLSARAQTTPDQQAVVNATVAAVESRFAPSNVISTVSSFAIVNNYALTTWLFGNGGGSAALIKKSGTWSVIGIGGGAMSASTLVSFGVPANVATSLAAKLPALPTPSPASS